jgi:hypothetical protein
VVVAIFKLPLPSKEPEPVIDPVKLIVLAVANFVAVVALVALPYKAPMNLGAVKLPVIVSPVLDTKESRKAPEP